MTLHNAKGLEFRAVFMIGMEEGVFPHSRSIEENALEEERRLAYVGMTRAKERLTLTRLGRARSTARRNYNLPSRFLDELPEEGRPRAATADLVVGLRLADGEVAPRRRSRSSRPATTSGIRRSARASYRGRARAGSSASASPTRTRPRLVLDYAPLERVA